MCIIIIIGHSLVWGPILTINYDFCLNKHIICWLLSFSLGMGKD